MVLIVLIIAVVVIWALYGLWGVKTYTDSLEDEMRQLSDSIIAQRKKRIIADGRRIHKAWQKNHPILGRFYSYKPDKFFADNQFNTEHYPY